MKVLIVTQGFYPDTVSVGQHAEDLAISLVERGHEVNVFTSKFTYENNEEIEGKFEIYQGIKIHRIRNTRFSKRSILGRLSNFLSFNIILFFRLLFFSKKEYDLILGMTLPPFVSFFAVLIAKLKRKKFAYWVMDVQPGLAIVSGMIKEGSLMAKFWQYLGDFICKKSDRIIVLDRFMKQHLLDRNIAEEKMHVVPVWPIMIRTYEGPRMENPFRLKHNFGEKIVVMYSGNHSVVHPLDDILEVALNLRDDDRFLFVFIGGGIRTEDVRLFKDKHNLDNIVQLPFQPRKDVHISLGSSDLQLVILGDGQVGYTHPNKLYGAIFIGKPVIYIGPSESHVQDIIKHLPGNISVEFDQVQSLQNQILAFAELPESKRENIGKKNQQYAQVNFDPIKLRNRMVDILEEC